MNAPADTSAALQCSTLGLGGLLFEVGGPLSESAQQRIWALAEAVEQWPEVQEAMPGMNNLALLFDPARATAVELQQRVQAQWQSPNALRLEPRLMELPTVYGGERGPDLQLVAKRAELSISDTVDLHSNALYTVFFLGAQPGFAYLGGLDRRLHTPRRAEPRLSVPAGSVAIGGEQTGAIAQTSPSGWQLIGHTDVVFFDPVRSSPALLSPGDQVRFRAVRLER